MSEMVITFAFSPGEKVKTPWGDMGIVEDCAVNLDGGLRYYVLRDENSKWFTADQLTPWTDAAPIFEPMGGKEPKAGQG